MGLINWLRNAQEGRWGIKGVSRLEDIDWLASTQDEIRLKDGSYIPTQSFFIPDLLSKAPRDLVDFYEGVRKQEGDKHLAEAKSRQQ
jgi:hypothetical protein